jgi:hypothetical protein
MRSFAVLGIVVAIGLSCSPDRGPESQTLNLGGLDGAIFTTTPDGAIVNENVRYKKKIEVYLDGGPGPNAPASAAGLPEGNYYFQVTDPSGKVLLSEDPALCREIHVNAYGVIDEYVSMGRTYDGTPCDKQDDNEGKAGKWGKHDVNIDTDHGSPPENAIVVQLMPFADTPNNGGVYKAWIVAKAAYEVNGDPTAVPEPLPKVKGKSPGFASDPGFTMAHKYAKTDNFKVKEGPVCDIDLKVKKFHDKDGDGVFNAADGDEWVTGWMMTLDPPGDGLPDLKEYTPVLVDARPTGVWTVTEDLPDNNSVTALIVDGTPVVPAAATTAVDVPDVCNTSHEVIFGNQCIGSITACKYYDPDKDGQGKDKPIEGWKIQLTKPDASTVTQYTKADGCTTFLNLPPGDYTVMEVIPGGGTWTPVDVNLSKQVTIESTLSYVDGKPIIKCTPADVDFYNFCTGTAGFGTKGYWHNKNGLQEITDADIAHVNTLDPYDDFNPLITNYFDAGDEPFDGKFANGDPVAAAYSNLSGYLELIAGEGTARAEISHFLVDTNATADPREQLAQQLLAFIFNVRNRLGGSAMIQLPDTTWVSSGKLINDAIAAWQGTNAFEQNKIKDLLDALNNQDETNPVVYIPDNPCPVPAGY